MDQIVEDEARDALVEKVRAAALDFRVNGVEPEVLDHRRRLRALRRAHRRRRSPSRPFWGVQEIPVDMDELYSHLDTHVLFKLHWGGQGVKGEAWKQAASTRGASARAWSACGASRPTCTRAR